MEKIADVIGMAEHGTGMVSGLLTYYGRRNELLIGAEMGNGEYAYWYALAVLAWLRWDPLSNPEVQAVLDETEMHGDATELRADLAQGFTRHLRNAGKALGAKATRTPEEEGMMKRISDELAKDRSSGTIPFADSFPPEWAAAFEPYRARIEATLPDEAAEVVLDLASVDADEDHVRFVRSKSHREETP
jgi:hypothetical protein